MMVAALRPKAVLLRTTAEFPGMIDKIDENGLILLELWENPCLLEHFRQNCCLLRHVLWHNSVSDRVIWLRFRASDGC